MQIDKSNIQSFQSSLKSSIIEANQSIKYYSLLSEAELVNTGDSLDIRDKIIEIEYSQDINSINLVCPNQGQEDEFMNDNPKLQAYLKGYLVRACEKIFSVCFRLLSSGRMESSEIKDYSAKNIMTHILSLYKSLHQKIIIMLLVKENIYKEICELQNFRKSLQAKVQKKQRSTQDNESEIDGNKVVQRKDTYYSLFANFKSHDDLKRKKINQLKGFIQKVQSQIVKKRKEIPHKKMEDMLLALFLPLTSYVENNLKQITDSIKDYYPKDSGIGATTKISKTLKDIDRREDFKIDFLSNFPEIKFSKPCYDLIKQSSKKSQEQLIQQNIYQLLNQLINVVPDNMKDKTHFEIFQQFSENIFCLAGKSQLTELFSLPEETRRQKQEKIYKYLFLSDENTDLNILKKIKQTKKDSLKQKKYAIGFKISKDVKKFKQNTNQVIKNSCLLRILNKWYNQLMDMLKESEKYMKNTSFLFKRQNDGKIQYVELDQEQKDIFESLMKQKYSDLIKFEQSLIEQNKIIQSEIFHGIKDRKSCFSERYLEVREVSSRLNSILRDIMMKLLINTLKVLIEIPSLASQRYILKKKAQYEIIFSEISIKAQQYKEDLLLLLQEDAKKMQQISLITFKLGDLLRSKIQCSEDAFLNILKLFYSLDKYNLSRNQKKFKLVVIKNKFKDGSNQALICYEFLGKCQCELQVILAGTSEQKKSHYYHSYSHFLYELSREKFGFLSGLSAIISENDPILKRSQTQIYMPQSKEAAAASKLKPVIMKKSFFRCSNCNYISNKKAQFLKLEQNTMCISCSFSKKTQKQILVELERQESDNWILYALDSVNIAKKFETQNEQKLETGQRKILFSIYPADQTIKISFWLLVNHKKIVLTQIPEDINNVDASKLILYNKTEDIFKGSSNYFFYQIVNHNFITQLYSKILLLKKIENQQTKIKKQLLNNVLLIQNRIKSSSIDKLDTKIYQKESINYLEKIQNNSIQSLRLTQKNKIQYTHIERYDLSHLKFLVISEIRIKKFNLIKKQNILKEIILTDCLIQQINLLHLNCQTLIKLDLSKNLIKQLSWQIVSRCKNLKTLNLYKNHLQKVLLIAKPIQMKIQEECVRQIILSNNKLTQCVIIGFVNITSIDISTNKLTTIDFRDLHRLVILNAEDNYLKDSKFLPALPNLKKLNLSKNIQLLQISLSFHVFLTKLILKRQGNSERSLVEFNSPSIKEVLYLTWAKNINFTNLEANTKRLDQLQKLTIRHSFQNQPLLQPLLPPPSFLKNLKYLFLLIQDSYGQMINFDFLSPASSLHRLILCFQQTREVEHLNLENIITIKHLNIQNVHVKKISIPLLETLSVDQSFILRSIITTDNKLKDIIFSPSVSLLGQQLNGASLKSLQLEIKKDEVNKQQSSQINIKKTQLTKLIINKSKATIANLTINICYNAYLQQLQLYQRFNNIHIEQNPSLQKLLISNNKQQSSIQLQLEACQKLQSIQFNVYHCSSLIIAGISGNIELLNFQKTRAVKFVVLVGNRNIICINKFMINSSLISLLNKGIELDQNNQYKIDKINCMMINLVNKMTVINFSVISNKIQRIQFEFNRQPIKVKESDQPRPEMNQLSQAILELHQLPSITNVVLNFKQTIRQLTITNQRSPIYILTLDLNSTIKLNSIKINLSDNEKKQQYGFVKIVNCVDSIEEINAFKNRHLSAYITYNISM